MAEATRGTGLRAGFQREAFVTTSTWPAATAAALTRLWPLLDLQPTDGVEQAVSMSTASGLGATGVDILRTMPAAPVTLKAVYEGLEPLWACALGYMAKRIGTTVLPELLATGVYRHLYELDVALSSFPWNATTDGFLSGELTAGQRRVRRGTFAVDMQVSVWEWLSSMIQSLTLRAAPGGVTLSIELVAYSLSRTSSVNTSATMTALLPSVAPGLLFSDATVRVAPYSTTTALASGDAIKITSFEVHLENALAASPGPRTGRAPEEYERTGVPTVTFAFTDPRHTADTWQQRWGAGTMLMADVKFTSERLIAVGQPYKCNLYLPSLKLTQGTLGIAGAALPADTVQCIALVPAGSAAGFPSTVKNGPLSIEVVSSIAQHPLL